jgi:transposase
MFGEFRDVTIYLKPGVTDFRKSVNGLSVMAQELMKKEPMSGNLFVFCNRHRNRLKVLYWDRNGFCLWYKRLEEEKFVWPKDEGEAMEIAREEFLWLLRGLDFRRAHKKLSYTKVS